MANLNHVLKVIIGSHEGAAHLLEQMQEEGSQGEEGGAQGEAAEEEGGIIQVGLFKPDPDPVFQVNPDPDTDLQIHGFDDQNYGKNTADFLILFYIKNGNLLIPRLLKGRPSYRRNL
jgi:hypothetical protein